MLGLHSIGGAAICGVSLIVTSATTKTGGKGDNPAKSRKSIIKPTGLVDRKPEGIPEVEDRIQEAQEIALEVSRETEKQFTDASESDNILISMQLSDMDREISESLSKNLKKRIRTDEEEAMLLILLALS